MEQNLVTGLGKPFKLVFPMKVAADEPIIEEQDFLVAGFEINGEIGGVENLFAITRLKKISVKLHVGLLAFGVEELNQIK
jgi:hypothetical protein